jgi:NADH:ubiquinone oxidoreductase subunit
VPPDWHAWLHHTIAEPPPPGDPVRHSWEKEHRPNLTGTGEAYRPPGHTLSGGKRARGTGDYEPWTPE